MGIKKGFTMTEILVAMSIVGVLAAIMIPAFYRSKPNQEMLMLKKSYYMMSRTISELINDDDFYNENEGFSDLKEVNYRDINIKSDKDEKFCRLVAARMNTNIEPNCTNKSFTDGTPSEGQFTTQDGIAWIMPISKFQDSNKQDIWVDVNGTKGPNCVAGNNCQKNPDRFNFKVDKWGKLSVEDDLAKRYLASTNTVATYKEIMK